MMPKQLRLAARTLVRSPGFSLIAILTLALGIGANAALFTILDAVVLEPLPYPASDRLVVVRHPVPGIGDDEEWRLSVAGYFQFHDNATTLEGIGAYTEAAVSVAGDGPPERADAAIATASLLDVLGARAASGRVFTDEDDLPSAAPVVVLGHDFWRRRYGGDPSAIGRTVDVNGTAREIVGVLAPGVHLPDRQVDLWMPYGLDRNAEAINSHYLLSIARLRPGVAPEAARSELLRMVSRFPELFPGAYSRSFIESTRFDVRVGALRDEVIGGIGRALWVLFAAVGLVLLIACANVANLFLVRTEARRREVALRTALGADRRSLAPLFYSESLLLAVLAGALALLLAATGIRILLAFAPPTLPRLAHIGIDGSTIAFTAVISVLAGLTFGSFPLLRFRQGESADALRDGGRGMSPSPARQRVRNGLVIGQVAMALVLLVAAGLMLESSRRLRAIDPGFEARDALVFDVLLNQTRYPDNERLATFAHQLLGQLAELRGVQAAGVTTVLPLEDRPGCYAMTIEDRQVDARDAAVCRTTLFVGPGFFAAMGIRVQGREFTAADDVNRTGGVIVSRSLAARLWPGQDPIGKGIKPFRGGPPYYRVIGVTDDVRLEALDAPAADAVYLPLVGLPDEPEWWLPRVLRVIVRTTTPDPAALAPHLRRIVSALDPVVPVANIIPLEEVIRRTTVRTSFTMLLLGVAAGIALALGAVGIYGVLAYVVSQRRMEIGVRMALGARTAQVRNMVLAQSLKLVAAGILIGVAGALAFTRVLASLLHDVSPTDPITFAAVSALLVGVAALASYLPASRAAQVDPMRTLRGE